MVEPLDPASGLLVVVNLMFGTAALSLDGPRLEKTILVKNMCVMFSPFSEDFATRTVNGSEAAQLPELLRELRDFR